MIPPKKINAGKPMDNQSQVCSSTHKLCTVVRKLGKTQNQTKPKA